MQVHVCTLIQLPRLSVTAVLSALQAVSALSCFRQAHLGMVDVFAEDASQLGPYSICHCFHCCLQSSEQQVHLVSTTCETPGAQ